LLRGSFLVVITDKPAGWLRAVRQSTLKPFPPALSAAAAAAALTGRNQGRAVAEEFFSGDTVARNQRH